MEQLSGGDSVFLAIDTPVGAPVTADRIEWREIPAGVIEIPELDARVAAVDLEAGTPLTTAMLRTADTAPADWMAIPVAVPSAAPVGSDVQLVLTATGETVPGRVVLSASNSGFGFEEAGLVAVPPEHVAAVAIAAATSDLVVAIRSGP